MNIRAIENGETLAITGVDEMHAANWKLVLSDITRLFDANNARHIELDLSEIAFIDSYGVGLLIALNRIVQQRDGNLRVKNPSRLARAILEVTRMHRLIVIEGLETEGAASTVSPVHSCLAA